MTVSVDEGAARRGADRRGGFWPGVLAGLVFVVAELLGQVLAGVPTMPELLLDRLVRFLPGPLFSFLLDRLLYLGKPLFFSGLILAQLALAGLAGMLVHRWGRPYAWAGALWLGCGAILLPAFGAGLFGDSWAVAVVTACGFALWALALRAYGLDPAAAERRSGPAASPPGAEAGSGPVSAPLPPEGPTRTRPVSGYGLQRRRLIGGVLGTAASLALTERVVGHLLPFPGAEGSAGRSGPAGPAPAAGTGPDAAGAVAATGGGASFAAMPPAVTPLAQFYVVSKNLVDPVVDEKTWQLRLDGMVDHPLTLRYADILALPSVQAYRTLECISNNIGGNLISTGRFEGVRLAGLLQRAGVRPGAAVLHFTSADGYTENMPLAQAMSPETLLAYRLDGQTLPTKHGFPLRVLGINTFGMKNPKWLTHIELRTSAPVGFWEQQGWSNQAIVQTMSAIEVPASGTDLRVGDVAVGGVAFAGGRGIRRVEVSEDGGRTWAAARLLPPPGPNAWVLWEHTWHVARAGAYTLAVRATDGQGVLQTGNETGSFPNGATGYDRVHVRVSA